MKKILLAFLFVTALFGQNNYPADFIAPLEIPIDLSGSFGELRSNHFHSGIDIKTQKKVGLKVFAVADGYVSRIKISPYGYGKAIYITHPNGYTTVYAHLQKANGAIEEYIKQYQYTKKKYAVEMFLSAKELPVKQGEVIAFSGNSGSSSAPHLHFEFRETKSEKIVNPMHFGFSKYITDKHQPQLQILQVYPFENAVVNGSEQPIIVPFTQQKNGNYVAKKVITNGKIGFAINAIDRCTNPFNKNGLFEVKAYLNGVLYYHYNFDKFAFSETRYINNFIDYDKYKRKKQRFQKLFYKNKYPLSVIKATNKTNGIIFTQPNKSYTFTIEMTDFEGNKSTVTIPIEYGKTKTTISKKETRTPYAIVYNREYIYEKDNVAVYIPKNAFYTNFYLDFKVANGVVTLQDKFTPLHKRVTLTFNEVQLTEKILEKTFIASIVNGKLRYNYTYRKGANLSAKIKTLGQFKLAQDTIKPTIYQPNFKEGSTYSTSKKLRIHIADNLSGIKTYNAYLNGKWILMEYDYKKKSLTHTLADKKYKIGKNNFKLVVTDNMKNSTTFETYFFINE